MHFNFPILVLSLYDVLTVSLPFACGPEWGLSHHVVLALIAVFRFSGIWIPFLE